jgi:hypothetical protein
MMGSLSVLSLPAFSQEFSMILKSSELASTSTWNTKASCFKVIGDWIFIGGGIGCTGVTSEVATALVDGVLLAVAIVWAALDSASSLSVSLSARTVLNNQLLIFIYFQHGGRNKALVASLTAKMRRVAFNSILVSTQKHSFHIVFTTPTIEVFEYCNPKKLFVYAVMEASTRLATPCRMLQLNQFSFCSCRGQHIRNPHPFLMLIILTGLESFWPTQTEKLILLASLAHCKDAILMGMAAMVLRGNLVLCSTSPAGIQSEGRTGPPLQMGKKEKINAPVIDMDGIVTLPHTLVHKPRPNRRTGWLMLI